MSSWKPAFSVFQGGTQQIKELKGKRVRAKVALSSIRIYDPIHHQQTTADLEEGSVGFVTAPQGADLLVAFPEEPNSSPQVLEALVRSGRFFVVQINGPTFKQRFDVES